MTIFFEPEDLSSALMQQGFGLEQETKKIFDKFAQKDGDIAHHNYAIKNHAIPEIDVYAKFTGTNRNSVVMMSKYNFIVECKGANVKSELYLNESDSSSTEADYCLISAEAKRLVSRDEASIQVHKRGNEFTKHYVRTSYGGDFYETPQEGQGLRKVDRNREENNVFKGEKQLITACTSLVNTDDIKEGEFIIPLIVTNRKIKIADYGNKKSYLVPWALNKISNANLDLINYIPYILICSLEHLEYLLKSILEPGPSATMGMYTVESPFAYSMINPKNTE